MATSDLPGVEAPLVEGVRMPRHELDGMWQLNVKLANHLAKRALEAFESGTETELSEDERESLMAWAKVTDVASKILLGLLKEQRERAAMKQGATRMTDAEYAAKMVEHVRSLPDDLFHAELERRNASAH